MELAIEVTGLSKRFGRSGTAVRALDGLDLQVATGEVHGFLGPNGAGKSTTIRVLLGLLRADGGQARLLGADPWTDAVALHRRLAYVPGDVDLWPNLSGGEAIDLIVRLHQRGSSPPSAATTGAARRSELLDRFELDPRRRVREYSSGNRRKVVLVAALWLALAGPAELVLLDEPTAGLDPLMEEVFRDYVGQLRGLGRTVLLSSHILSEVEALADRVTIIRSGRAVETGTLTELRHLSSSTVQAQLLPSGAVSAASAFAGLPGVHDVAVEGSQLTCQVEPAGLDGLLRALAVAGVTALQVRPPTLEELFLRHYSGPESSAESAANGPADRTGHRS